MENAYRVRREGIRSMVGPASLASCLAASILASCGGGGGAGGSGSGNLQSNPSGNYLTPAAEPGLPAVAGDWSGSLEYANSTGLAQLKAAEGYARRTGGLPGGEGVRIAIIDSGIDVTHPDLGNIADTSWSAGGEALVGDSHATFVAGIAGASRTQSGNANDIHGMAYRATLVNFQASRPSQTSGNGGVTFGTNDLVDAMRAASGLSTGSSAVESDIFNLSLGAASNSDSTFAKLRSAMMAAAAEDKIMVLAAGNDGGDQPIYPAAYADDSGVAGHAIVVGNLTATDQAAASSNRCGDVQDYCLFAPGTAIRSTLNDGGYGFGSGTSFAAPYVAGAAAVVKAAFPGVSSRDVVDRLLLTAEDLGAAGVDDVYGRGKLDLEAAMAPVGPTGFPLGSTVDAPRAPVRQTALRLGPGLGLNEPSKRVLARAMAVDDMGFPFPVDLGEAVLTTARHEGLEAFLGGERTSAAVVGGRIAEIAAFVPDEASSDLGTSSPTAYDGRLRGDRPVPLQFAAELGERASIFASVFGGGGERLGLEAGLVDRRATFMQADDLLSPLGDLAGASSGVGFGFSPADGTEIALAAFGSVDEGDGVETSLQRFEIAQTMPGEIEMRVGVGLLQEEGGFAGGEASGAFGDGMSARSRFLTVSLLAPLAADVDVFATYSHGRSSIGDAEGALLDDWSDARAEAFGAGVVIRDLARDDDGLTLAAGQPFRQKGAGATIDLSVARTADGSVETAKRRLDFTPAGREIAAEIGYRLPLGRKGDHEVRAAGFVRIAPDHDDDRDPEAGIGLAYRWLF